MKLYSKLIDATNTIVNQFGKSIIQEERFVNILLDMFPDRDNPALYRIIKSAIKDDLLKCVLVANVKSIESQVAFASSALSKKYGYDKPLVEGILFSIAIGYGTITTAQYNALQSKKNKPSKKQSLPPSQKNNFNPSKQKNSLSKSPSKYDSTVKYTAVLIWGVLGLLISPVIYVLQININEWWPLPTSIVIALIHFLTVLVVSVSFENNNPKQIHPTLLGAFCALQILAIFFWIAFPFFWGFESVQSYWGFIPNKESFPYITTIFFNFLCAGVLSAGSATIDKLSINLRKSQGKYSGTLIGLFSNNLFRNGFIIVFVFFLIEGVSFISIPIVIEYRYKNRIEAFNEQVNAFNKHSDSIRSERIKTERELSFSQFKLGDSFMSCISKIKSGDGCSVYKDRGIDHLIMKEKDYISIIDTIVETTKEWNNEAITIHMFFSKKKLFALEFSPKETNGDSILAIYSAKYGEPESYLENYIPSDYDLPRSDYSLGYFIMNEQLIPAQFYWTFKNSIIKIYYKKGDYSNNYEYYNHAAIILYFDRAIESVMKKYNEEQARKEQIEMKRQSDSLRLVRKAEEEKRREKKRLEELNHKRSIEQI